MEIILYYNVESETKTLLLIKKRAPFYIEQKYKVALPNRFDLNRLSKSNEKEIIKIIEEELDQQTAGKFLLGLKRKWERNEKEILEELEKLPGEIPEQFVLQATSYGPGSFYNIWNGIGKAVIRIDHPQPLGSLIHELIHVIIHFPIVEKYNLTDSEKESIVDHLMISSKVLNSFCEKGYQIFGPPSEELLKKVGLK